MDVISTKNSRYSSHDIGSLIEIGGIEYSDLTFDKKIGEGGFGSVYKGTHKKTVVAIKEAISLFTPEEREDFVKECRIMSELISEYIVQFLGVVETPDKLCIVTEYMPLGSLDKAFIKKKELFTPQYKLRIAKDVAKGIKFMHSNGIIHRDIKPGNVLISSFSLTSPVVCKICDFGTSKISVQSSITMAKMTKGVGTPQYMAPEILEGCQSYEYAKACDVYSYSILLLETWEVKDVFGASGMSHFEICKFVIDGKRLEIPNYVDKKIANLIKMCWAQKPEERPSFDEIDTYLDGVKIGGK